MRLLRDERWQTALAFPDGEKKSGGSVAPRILRQKPVGKLLPPYTVRSPFAGRRLTRSGSRAILSHQERKAMKKNNTKKKKRARKSPRKARRGDAIREFSALATSRARLKRMLETARLLAPRPPKRPKREPSESIGDRRMGPARVRPSVSAVEHERKKIMREHDPIGERRRDLEDLWEEHRAIRDAGARKLATVNTELQRGPTRPRSPKRGRGPRRRKTPRRAW